MAAASSRRTRPLHNFALPELKWANQRLLRCVNPVNNSSSIDAVRDKLMGDLRHAADQIRVCVEPPPWNLRTRRAVCRNPVEDAAESPKVRRRFEVGLTKEEIEKDFREMIGVKPARRPKKRPRTVQREIDQLFPGLGLTEVTLETYKVDEVAE